VREHGQQPLDKVIEEQGLSGDDLVKASTLQLTFKQLQNARKGRYVSLNIQNKILRALNAFLGEDKYRLEDLFNYKAG